MKKTHTIGYVTEHQKATGIHNTLATKFSEDVCCVWDTQIGKCRVFSHCSPQAAKRMTDFLNGWLFAQQ